MIRRKLLIAAAIIACVVITACSDMTAPKKLVSGGLPALSLSASSSSNVEGNSQQGDNNGSEPRSGALHVTKECSAYTGLAGSFCTITSSNLKEIKVGSRVVYAKAAGATSLDSDVILYPPGRGNNTAFGHVVLVFATGLGTVTFSGGTGKFTRFHASVVVSRVGAPVLKTWRWDGTYSFGGKDRSTGDTPNYNLEVILRGDGFGHVKFRQPGSDDAHTVFLGVWVRDLEPNTSYELERAVDTTLDGNCTGTSWLTLGKGAVPQSIVTDENGTGTADLFRTFPPALVGLTFDIHFHVIRQDTKAVVLTSECYQFTVR